MMSFKNLTRWWETPPAAACFKISRGEASLPLFYSRPGSALFHNLMKLQDALQDSAAERAQSIEPKELLETLVFNLELASRIMRGTAEESMCWKSHGKPEPREEFNSSLNQVMMFLDTIPQREALWQTLKARDVTHDLAVDWTALARALSLEDLQHNKEACARIRGAARLIGTSLAVSMAQGQVQRNAGPAQPDEPRAPSKSAASMENSHSPDFRSIRWNGRNYTLTTQQAAVVKELWSLWEKGLNPEMGWATLQTIIDAGGNPRWQDIFKQLEGYKELIESGSKKGTVRLVVK